MSKRNAIKKLLAIGSFLGLGAGAAGGSAFAATSPTTHGQTVSAEISVGKNTNNNKINTRIGEKKAQEEMLADRMDAAFTESIQTVRKVPGKPRAVSLDIPGRDSPLEVEIPDKYASEETVMQTLCEKIVEANIECWHQSIAEKKVKDVNDLELSIYKYLDPKVQATVVHNSIEEVMTHRRKLSVEEFNTLSKSQPADEVNKEAKSIINKKGLLGKAMNSRIRYYLIGNSNNMYNGSQNASSYEQESNMNNQFDYGYGY